MRAVNRQPWFPRDRLVETASANHAKIEILQTSGRDFRCFYVFVFVLCFVFVFLPGRLCMGRAGQARLRARNRGHPEQVDFIQKSNLGTENEPHQGGIQNRFS